MPYRATQDTRVKKESSDKTWSTGEGNGKPLQYSCLENPMDSMKRQKDRTLKDEFPRWVGAQYATGEEWRNNSRKKEEMEPKWKQHPAVDVTGNGSKVRWCKVFQGPCIYNHLLPCLSPWSVMGHRNTVPYHLLDNICLTWEFVKKKNNFNTY